ncbi:MAG TPA: hypothetical protein P5340_11000 [Defluviicoccus sp.]|nr:hypothetical protein [Defluviicoccus sp.]
MMSDAPSFSRRHGYRSPDAEITVRKDAPEAFRQGLVMLANSLGLTPHSARSGVCSVLLRRPDPNNWSAYPNVFDEVNILVDSAPWPKVYDIAETFYQRLETLDPPRSQEFEDQLNDLFRENGIGWEMQGGQIVARGSEAFSVALRTASGLMEEERKPTSAQEIHEALADISRRPNADVTGAIQHAMAALECVARDVTGETRKTLGQLIPQLRLPKPLDTAVEKMWGFASEQGRHVREGRSLRFEDAELVTTVAAALSVYLLRSAQGRS